jgi:membrane-associated phospholipid phosphatase
MWNVLLFGAAAFVGLSRIIDNKHHNSDVIFGSFIGIVLGVSIVSDRKFLFNKYAFRSLSTCAKSCAASASKLTLHRKMA